MRKFRRRLVDFFEMLQFIWAEEYLIQYSTTLPFMGMDCEGKDADNVLMERFVCLFSSLSHQYAHATYLPRVRSFSKLKVLNSLPNKIRLLRLVISYLYEEANGTMK